MAADAACAPTETSNAHATTSARTARRTNADDDMDVLLAPLAKTAPKADRTRNAPSPGDLRQAVAACADAADAVWGSPRCRPRDRGGPARALAGEAATRLGSV